MGASHSRTNPLLVVPLNKSTGTERDMLTLKTVADAAHILVVGESGSGKSTIVRGLLRRRSGQAIVCDPHQATPNKWPVPSVGNGEDWRAIVYQLQRAQEEMKTRYRTPAAKDAPPPSRLTLVLDEVRGLLQHAPEAALIIRDLLARGRAANIGLIVVAHDDTASALGLTTEYNLIHNYSFRIYLGAFALKVDPSLAGQERPRIVYATATASWHPLRMSARPMLAKSARGSARPGHKWLSRERTDSGEWHYTYHQHVSGAAPDEDSHGGGRQLQLFTAQRVRNQEQTQRAPSPPPSQAEPNAAPAKPKRAKKIAPPPPETHIESHKRRFDQGATQYPDRTYHVGSIFGNRTEALHTIETSLAGKQLEHAYAVAELPDGRTELLSYHIGDKSSVQFTDDDIVRFKTRSAILTHNHPSNNSFSPEDVYMLLHSGLSEIRAIAADRVYVMQRTPSAAPLEQAERMVHAANAATRTKLTQAIREGRMTNEEASAQHWHILWSAVADHIGLAYHVENLQKE